MFLAGTADQNQELVSAALTCCRQQEGTDHIGSVFKEAESLIEELCTANGMVRPDGSVHLATNQAIVLDAIKPKT